MSSRGENVGGPPLSSNFLRRNYNREKVLTPASGSATGASHNASLIIDQEEKMGAFRGVISDAVVAVSTILLASSFSFFCKAVVLTLLVNTGGIQGHFLSQDRRCLGVW